MTLELPAEKIAGALREAGVPYSSIFLADEFYALLTRKDVQKKLAAEMQNLIRQTGFKFAADRRDCDDFARWAATWAGFFHALQTPPVESGLAFGEVWCEDLEHAFNFAVHASTASASKLAVAFYEPQISGSGFSMNEIKLTPAQTASIYLIKA